MTEKAQSQSSSTSFLVMVDYTHCRLGLYKGSKGHWVLQDYVKCSPGKASTPTVIGNFKIYSKVRTFVSGRSWCHYASFFHGNYGMHSILYNKNGSLQDGRLGMHLSHGCVRLNTDFAKYVYFNVPVGTTVKVYK